MADNKVQILVRCSEEQRERYKAAAAAEDMTMSEWIRSLAEYRAAEVLHCVHPHNMRRRYPWAEFCMKCGTRLRDGDVWLIDEALR